MWENSSSVTTGLVRENYKTLVEVELLLLIDNVIRKIRMLNGDGIRLFIVIINVMISWKKFDCFSTLYSRL